MSWVSLGFDSSGLKLQLNFSGVPQHAMQNYSSFLKGKKEEKGTKERVCGEKGLVLLQCFR